MKCPEMKCPEMKCREMSPTQFFTVIQGNDQFNDTTSNQRRAKKRDYFSFLDTDSDCTYVRVEVGSENA